MNCKEVLELLGDWVDGELTVERSAEIESHFDGCIDCAAEKISIERLKQLVRLKSSRSQSSPEFKSKFLDGVMNRLENANGGTSENLKLALETNNPSVPSVKVRKLSYLRFAAAAILIISSGLYLAGIFEQSGHQIAHAQVLDESIQHHLQDSQLTGHTHSLFMGDCHQVESHLSDFFKTPVNLPAHLKDLEFVGGRQVLCASGRGISIRCEIHGKRGTILVLKGETESEKTNHICYCCGSRDDGYQVVCHSNDGFYFSFVSDLSKEEISQYMTQFE